MSLGKRKRKMLELTNATQEEIKKQERKETRNANNLELIGHFKDKYKDLVPSEMNMMMRMMKQQMTYGVDVGYIQSIIFPERFANDVPLPLSSVSYSRFTDKQELHITPGTDGTGMLVFYPRTNGGPSVFYFPGGQSILTDSSDKIGTVTTIPGAGSGISTQDVALSTENSSSYHRLAWQCGCVSTQWVNFNQTALVSASISIQYIGRVEMEAGELVGGHLHGVGLHQINTDEINNAQWYHQGRPGDGFRAVYIPKDSSDFDFYPTVPGVAYNQGCQPLPMIQQTNLISADAQYSNSAIMNLNIAKPTTPFSYNDARMPLITGPSITGKYTYISNENSPWKETSTTLIDGSPVTGIQYARNTSCIAVYFSGLQGVTTSPQFRVDITRRFLGVPKSSIRDIVDLVRPVKNADPQKTFNVLNQISAVAPIGAHSLKEIDMAIDPLMENIANIAWLSQGDFKYPMYKTLGAFAGDLTDPRGLQGKSGDIPERLYKFYL